MIVCMVVNKDDGDWGFSETFLQAHAERLPDATVLPLVGNPGYRRRILDGGRFLMSRRLVPLGLRFGLRSIGLATAEEQDTRSLAAYLRRNRVDVVLAEYGPTAVSVRAACVTAGVPLVAHFHGWDAYVLPRQQAVLTAYKSLFRDAAAIVAVSRHMAEHLQSLGAPGAKVRWNPCGAPLPPLSASPQTTPPLFAAVGRFIPKKAPFLTLTAFSRVLESIPEARMEMIGTGPLFDSCRQLARGLGVGHAVEFRGAVTNEEVYALLRRARCFVQHSVEAPDGDSEGTPVAVLEAMASGLPVVATRHTGIQDVVTEGVTGTLVDEYDIGAMASAMLAYASDAEQAATVGAAAREAVASQWSLDISLAKLRAILEDARN